jgi:hypothetical protein
MGYIYAQELTPHDQRTLVNWIKDEGLDPQEISGEGFSVHKGRISGYKFLFDDEGRQLFRGNDIVRVPFNVTQKHPLPKELDDNETV